MRLSLPPRQRTRRLEPKRYASGLHGLLDNRNEVVGQQVEVHLISQALAKNLDGSSGVVLAAIEPTIYESLNPLTRGTKESGHSEGRAIPPMNDAKPVAVRAFILQV